MENVNLLSISISAFLIVFLILSILALMMFAIIKIFPEKESLASDDTALYAALTTTIQTIFPGTKVTKIEEDK